ncbi:MULTISPECIES: hypothetical protein [unclassified Pseudonocardia]|uniref:hypothetical protein n=1 Tax=unclassified Pseudonocardia TaxID=2619320 RepID=UPI00095EC092|nr:MULTISPECIES: hypothetical protein [unclassified Pseudonocardia]MBN9097828.1 hypothetical protein [Pseudonocardia sp.]OJY49160.1 MAG: hypothetical protein BGP03_29385 [Pseudonocardia sp. 73-21]
MTLTDEAPPTVAEPTTASPWPRRIAGAALVFALCGILCAAAFGTVLALAATSDQASLARARDAVQQAAQDAAGVLNTLSPQDADAGLDRWEQVATGPLLAELQRSRPAFVSTIKQAQRSTAAKPVYAAVESLDPGAGTASVLVSTDITTTPRTGEPVTNRQRLEIVMTKTDQGWKASGVRVVGVGQ